MHSNLVAGTALAGSLLISTFMWGAAQAASAPDLKGALGNSSAVTLVGHGGGHMGGGGGGGMSGGHMGGAHIMSGGGAGRAALGSGGNRSMSGGSGHFRGMSVDSGHFKSSGNYFKSGSGPRNFSKRDLNNGPSGKGRDRYAGNNWKNGKNVHDHDHKHVAMNDRDHDHDKFNHFNRHRVYRNGVWVWLYGPDYYAGDDCSWLLRRAQTTGSGYWWSRYNACVGYY